MDTVNGPFVRLAVRGAHEEVAGGNSREMRSGSKRHRAIERQVPASAVTVFGKGQYSSGLMGPFTDITVLDLTRVLSGPYCTMLLADIGARVIKIEQPGKRRRHARVGSAISRRRERVFLSINRNKESVTLDFKHPEGRAILDQLIAKADVVVENFRPGTLERS